MRVEHPYVPGIHPIRKMILEVRECATLGTNFADVYLNDVLFARELSRLVAEQFVKHPMAYTNAFADVAKLRTWILEVGDTDATDLVRQGAC